MLRLCTSTAIYAMSQDNAPAARVSSGSTVIFETMDCFENQIQSAAQLLSGIDWNHINPATGPLFVEGAQPGDLLRVEIQDIRLASHGVMTALPGEGAVGHLLTAEQTRIIPITDGKARFSDELELDLSPMIGVIGTAPADGVSIPTGTPGAHGGNMDNRRIGKGSVLYLPVYTPGALLAMGDLHALMSDGEVLICGLEIPGEIQVRVDVVKGVVVPVPLVCNEDLVMTVASALTLDEAALTASQNMMRLLTGHTRLDPQAAGMLLSLVGQLCICQIVDPMKTARMEFPRAILSQYGWKLP